MITDTKYIIVPEHDSVLFMAKLLDTGYTLVISWVVDKNMHHILSKDLDEPL